MKKRVLLALVIAVFFSAFAFAQEQRSIAFTFTFHKNGSVEASDIWARYGAPDLRNVADESDYKIVLSFKDGSKIEQFYNVVFLIAAETETGSDLFEAPYTLLNAEFEYKDDIDKVEIYRKNEIIFQQDLEFLCNSDNLCNNKETSISCPSDCQKSIKDGWCDSLQDNICDPDCQIEADIDCSCGNNICDTNENAENCRADCFKPEHVSEDAPKFLALAIIAIIILLAGLFAAYRIYKRKKNEQ